MKIKIKNIIIVYILIAAILPAIYAQDDRQSDLPDGAIARLGKGGINVMKFSTDGTKLAIGTSIGVWLIHVEDEKEYALPVGNIRYFNTLAFSTDGNILASGGIINQGIQIWDIESGKKISTIALPDRFHRVSELTFSNENKTIVGLGANRYITQWDVYSGKEISQKKAYFSRQVHAFSPDGRTFVSGHQESGEISIWTTKSGFEGNEFQENTDMSTVAPLPSFAVENPEKRRFIGGIQALAYSPDMKTIVSAHNNHCIRIWDISTELERFTLKGHKEKINSVAFSPDSKIVASGSFDNTIHIWDIEKGKLKSVLTEHRNGIKALAFSPTEIELLASGSEDGTVRLWNVNSGQQRSLLASGFIHSIRALAFTEDNSILISAAENGTIQMWDVENGKELPFPSNINYDRTEAAVFSNDATLFAYRGAETLVESDGSGVSKSIIPQEKTRLLKLPTRTELLSIPHRTSALSISPDNRMIAIGNENDTTLSNIESKHELHRFESSHFFDRNAICFAPDNSILVTGGGPGEINLWDVKTGAKLSTFSDPFVGNASGFAFTRDGSILAAKYSGRIRFWDMKTEKQLYTTLAGDAKVVDILIFSPDGRLLLTTKWRREVGSPIQLWDVNAERELYRLSGHYEKIEKMVFSHDGKVLATAGQDGSILLWDWEQILDNIGREKIGKTAMNADKTTNAKPKYDSKVEESQAIIQWLEDNNWKLEKIGDKYKIAHGNSRVTIMDTNGGAMIIQDIKFEFTRDGILKITIKAVGSVDFTFDDKGELKAIMPDEPK